MPATTHTITRLTGLLLLILLTFALLIATPWTASAQNTKTDDAAAGEAPAGTGEEVIWSLTPAPDQNAKAGENPPVSIRSEIDPGGKTTDAVELTNFTNREITFDLHAADGIVSSSGAFDVLAPGEESEDAGTWITLNKDQVTVPAGESTVVGFDIAVPKNATPGDHPVGITASISSDNEGTVSTVSRVGVRVHLRVTGEVTPLLAITDVTTTYEQNWNPLAPGDLTVSWTLKNDGNVRLGADQLTQVEGPFGVNITYADAEEIHEVLPGDTVRMQTVHEGVWPLVYSRVQLEAIPLVVGQDEFDAELTTFTTHATAWIIPVPQLILIGLIIMLVLWWMLKREKNRKNNGRKKPATRVPATRKEKAEAKPVGV